MSIVPLLETCKRLRDAGWNQQTYFWYDNDDLHFYDWYVGDPECLSAPTLEEILNQLKGLADDILLGTYGIAWQCASRSEYYNDESAVEAAAELWIISNTKKDES